MLGEVATLAGPSGRRVAQDFGAAEVGEPGGVGLDERRFAQVFDAAYAVVNAPCRSELAREGISGASLRWMYLFREQARSYKRHRRPTYAQPDPTPHPDP